MWKEDEDVVLDSLPTGVIRQIRKGIKPTELKGLSVLAEEYIKLHQLSKMQVLLLAGLNRETAADTIYKAHTQREVTEQRSSFRASEGRKEKCEQKRKARR